MSHRILLRSQVESSEITFHLLGLKSGFVIAPVHQPDCSSDPQRWIVECLCTVMLTADWQKDGRMGKKGTRP